ncbi:GNAT family N-acetyltransferase [Dictyobacter kobayashii]|nr:GNAT family N-acetyltransferase [Dictyobacter kobayashii]
MESARSNSGSYVLSLRAVAASDLPVFFEQQLDAEANHMAAFTAKDPTNKDAFMEHWSRILQNKSGTIRTILIDGQVAGHVFSYRDEELEGPEVSYWIGMSYWGRGVATRALAAFLLDVVKQRPLYGRAAKDNIGSLRVLEKNGFTRIGEGKGFANARNAETEEFLLRLE